MYRRSDIIAGKRGLMCHYLIPDLFDAEGCRVKDKDDCANSFRVDNFIRSVKHSCSEYIIFTMGQNTGIYNAPNAVLEQRCGPGHFPERDLAGEIMEAAAEADIPFIAYLPCEIKSNPALQNGFPWNTTPGTDQSAFQTAYLEMIQYWAKRYGKYISGWWFDGCYEKEPFHNSRLRYSDWINISRAGNHDAIVSFNNSSYLLNEEKTPFPDLDYFAGECLLIENGCPKMPWGGKVFTLDNSPFCPNTQVLRHLLLPIDAFWWHLADLPSWIGEAADHFRPSPDGISFEPLAFSKDELQDAVRTFCSIGAAATFNVAILADGTLNPAAINTLAEIKK